VLCANDPYHYQACDTTLQAAVSSFSSITELEGTLTSNPTDFRISMQLMGERGMQQKLPEVVFIYDQNLFSSS
jgi:hypothetical protein